jgi:hypothetical protein
MKTQTRITRYATAVCIHHVRSTVMHTTTTIQTLSRILVGVGSRPRPHGHTSAGRRHLAR